MLTIDVQAVGKDGRLRRVRKIAPMQTRRAAEKLEHETRAELVLADDRAVVTAPEARRFADFAEQFVSTYAVTNNKHAEVIAFDGRRMAAALARAANQVAEGTRRASSTF